MNEDHGYIYIYKCMVGQCSDICKIGVSNDYKQRLIQHIRTPYYGFMPYCDFVTGKPIATMFEVSNLKDCDSLLKNYFKQYEVSSIEIYNIEYDKAVKEIHRLLKMSNQLISFIPDGISVYDFLPQDKLELQDETTKKAVYEDLISKINKKYNGDFPQDFINMLRDKEDFTLNCKSHMNKGSYVDVPGNYVLDINYNKAKKLEIKEKLLDILNR